LSFASGTFVITGTSSSSSIARLFLGARKICRTLAMAKNLSETNPYSHVSTVLSNQSPAARTLACAPMSLR
jgi:hypothetical protein